MCASGSPVTAACPSGLSCSGAASSPPCCRPATLDPAPAPTPLCPRGRDCLRRAIRRCGNARYPKNSGDDRTGSRCRRCDLLYRHIRAQLLLGAFHASTGPSLDACGQRASHCVGGCTVRGRRISALSRSCIRRLRLPWSAEDEALRQRPACPHGRPPATVGRLPLIGLQTHSFDSVCS
jgi:hypothetical protein